MTWLDCLLVQQPYASLIAFGRKRWEFRSYSVKRRGLIGIAASPSSVLPTKDPELNRVSQSFARGVMLARAHLVDCFFVTSIDLKKQIRSRVKVSLHGHDIVTLDAPIGEPEADVREASNSPSWASYVWQFEDVEPLNIPIPIVKSSRSTWTRVGIAYE